MAQFVIGDDGAAAASDAASDKVGPSVSHSLFCFETHHQGV